MSLHAIITYKCDDFKHQILNAIYYYYYYYNLFVALDFVRDYPGEPVPER